MWWEGGWIWYSREFGLCSFPPPTAHMGLLPLKWWVRGGSSLLPPSAHRRCVNPPNTCVGPTCAMGRVRFPHSYKLISSSLPPSPSFMFIAVVTTMWQSSVYRTVPAASNKSEHVFSVAGKQRNRLAPRQLWTSQYQSIWFIVEEWLFLSCSK